jgi:hypothetical protein
MLNVGLGYFFFKNRVLILDIKDEHIHKKENNTENIKNRRKNLLRILFRKAKK